jgi:diadenosine tetraphosphate (Ap4A) HIT family hydrolase
MPGAVDTYCLDGGFCQELSGATDTDFTRTYQGDPATRVIYRSDHLTLLADMSPLTVGHLLLVSNDHLLSFGAAISAHEDEVKDVLNSLIDHYARTFGEPILMEHGSSPNMAGSACITHAHMHFLPLQLDAVHRVMTQDGLAATELGTLNDLRQLGEQEVPYFYCGDRTRHHVYGVALELRRQYLRSVAGRLLHIIDPEWDYAVVVRRELLRITMARATGWGMTPS